MVGVAQWLEHLPVEQGVGGSNPLTHPAMTKGVLDWRGLDCVQI